jgi:uncharacterized membrane protein YuzA (DUF378 family)
MKLLDALAVFLLIVGGLNWGLVGVADFDLVATLFGKMSGFTRLIYTLVGISALYHGLQWTSLVKRRK